ncbi:MAG: GNAT family N-acetyltransferase [Candidatus Omnitrophica bacterium]|nr:GNAT family N-acetyltransferase [Candidatus Omnitrophota bacterium]
MEIRKATIKDFERLKDIKIKSKIWERKYNKSLKPIDEVKKRYFYYLKRDLTFKDRAIFIAVKNDKIIGMVLGKIVNTLSIIKFEKRGYISNLYILPRYRRKGIAKKLVRELIEWFRANNIKSLRLEVYSKNKPALNIYHKSGFKEYAIKMKKDL